MFDFHPYLGNWSNLTFIFFKMGWFNHQLDYVIVLLDPIPGVRSDNLIPLAWIFVGVPQNPPIPWADFRWNEAKLAALGSRIEQSGWIPGIFFGGEPKNVFETWKQWKQTIFFKHVVDLFLLVFWCFAHGFVHDTRFLPLFFTFIHTYICIYIYI